MRVVLYWLRPEWASALFVLLFLIMVGPCAGIWGSIYSATFSIAQAKNHARAGFTVPGIRLLAGVFSRRRTLLGALWFKVICNQSRNWLFWGRIGVTLVLVVLFPLYTAPSSPLTFPI